MKQFNVVLLGDSCSGKTCLLNLFFDKPNPFSTLIGGPSYFQHSIRIHEKEKCELNIWDTVGSEKFFKFNIFFLIRQDPLIVIICYDMNSENGKENIQYYIDSVKSSNGNAKIVILGTKQNLGEHENQKIIEEEFSDYRLFKVGLNSQEILNQIFYSYYDEVVAELNLIQEELQNVLGKKLNSNQQEQNLLKKQKKKGFWGLCTYEYDD